MRLYQQRGSRVTYRRSDASKCSGQHRLPNAEAPQAQKRVQLHKQYPTVEISGSVVDAITGEVKQFGEMMEAVAEVDTVPASDTTTVDTVTAE